MVDPAKGIFANALGFLVSGCFDMLLLNIQSKVAIDFDVLYLQCSKTKL